jgi:TolA-binding protein
MTVAAIKKQLKVTSSQTSKDKIVLDSLRSERAKLVITDSEKNKAKIKSLDKRIKRLTFDIGNRPKEIEVLKSQLLEETERQKQINDHQLLSKQEKIAVEIQSLSKQLVNELKIAVDTNEKLRQAFQDYVSLYKQTNKHCISEKVCRPSYGMLLYVYQILDKELQGLGSEQILRMPLPVGCPAI